MISPILVFDGRERWRPVPVEESLRLHGYEWRPPLWYRGTEPTKVIDLPGGMQPAVTLPIVGYHRVMPAAKLHWHQFWLWYTFNPKKYAGRGEHEGDWEMIQFGCKDAGGNEPILATYSQHTGGQSHCYWNVELSDGKTGQPVVYVARDSHANYFAPTRTVTDQADGKGVRVTPEWREFGAWASWPGKWGNSDNSPGRLSTRRAWNAPHVYHSGPQ
jgi:hypothetical protein